MNKEIINQFEHDFKETSDSCPKCGNQLVIKQENTIFTKYCLTESFDVTTKTVTRCGYSKVL